MFTMLKKKSIVMAISTVLLASPLTVRGNPAVLFFNPQTAVAALTSITAAAAALMVGIGISNNADTATIGHDSQENTPTLGDNFQHGPTLGLFLSLSQYASILFKDKSNTPEENEAGVTNGEEEVETASGEKSGESSLCPGFLLGPGLCLCGKCNPGDRG